MPPYSEYLTRAQWERSDGLQNWVAKSILKEFLHKTKIDPKVSDILEIGAGLGRAGQAAIALQFKSYQGVEPNRKLASHCREVANLNIVDGALPHLDLLSNDSFDAVISIHVLEHAVGHMEAREWCQEMLRVTKSGGYLLVVAPDLMDYKENFWSSDWTHNYPTTPERVVQIFNDLNSEIFFEGDLHLGRSSLPHAIVAHLLSALLPTRVGDAITKKLVGRRLVSGLKIAALWGMVFVIAKKP